MVLLSVAAGRLASVLIEHKLIFGFLVVLEVRQAFLSGGFANTGRLLFFFLG